MPVHVRSGGVMGSRIDELGWRRPLVRDYLDISFVVALSETIRIMAEIDEVIEAHGGWPGAFQVADEKN